ncbi:LuxR family transcriptional regulator [Amycolatopsis taiwanensis]|uniref:LuxR family transcriptional regulator n=1 Tax=Amycolatopsis taiwanensis TaxID=342230 RepID=A0A9W6R2K4_9PSEU|nr:LuxR family transcriptional regulator [Amycolatopsis taiwanensis]
MVADIKRLLSVSRLVTLTGVGGAGKTRLALRVAAELKRAFADGVWFVQLAALEDQALLTQTIASTLGLHDRTTRWPIPALTEYLSDKQLLLILDNCEHLRDACAVLADAALRAAPNLRILATSRQALGLTGEHLYQVPTMSMPEPDQLPPLDAISQYEAVSLFIDRAVAVQPRFTVTEANLETLIRICQRLDGLPLAIELAAVWLRTLSLDEILEGLNNRYRLLETTNQGVLPRHQTLPALIGWSYDLCSEAERTLWAWLSVFSGGFDRPAAEAVCRGDLDADEVVDLLAALVDKSIVIAEEHERQVRYRLLEMIRQYGQDRLRGQSSEHAVRQRHREYYAHMVEQAWQQWPGPDQHRWLARLRTEHGNIRAALESCLAESGQLDRCLRMAGELWFFWVATGLTSEGRRWLERGLALDGPPSHARAFALWVAAYLCVFQQDFATAMPMIAECRRDAEELDDAHAAAWAVQLSGMTAFSEGDLPQARAHLEDCLSMHRALDNTLGVLDGSFYLIAVTALQSNLCRAAALCDEAIAICDSRGEQWLKSYLLWDKGLVAWQLGDGEQAAESGRDALRLARQFNEQWVIGFCLEMLAWTAGAAGQHVRSARLLGGAQAIWRRVGAPLFGMRSLIQHRERCLAEVRKALGRAGFAAPFDSGASMPVDQVIAYALDEHQPSPEQQPAEGEAGGPLTRREMEVAELVALGLSNKAIADKLVVARRTAEAHVEHILSKLGFSSRTQIAAWVAEHRGTPGP